MLESTLLLYRRRSMFIVFIGSHKIPRSIVLTRHIIAIDQNAFRSVGPSKVFAIRCVVCGRLREYTAYSDKQQQCEPPIFRLGWFVVRQAVYTEGRKPCCHTGGRDPPPRSRSYLLIEGVLITLSNVPQYPKSTERRLIKPRDFLSTVRNIKKDSESKERR